MRLVFLGPPASGKGTQASMICRKLGIPSISTGEMLRIAREKGQLSQNFVTQMASGQLIPDETMIQLVHQRILQQDCEKGFILDGFPRTRPQAEALDALLESQHQKLDFVIAFQIPRELLVDRAIFRRVDKRTGQIYHLRYNPPPTEAELEYRTDDHEHVVHDRLDTYERMSKGISVYYKSSNRLMELDAVGSLEEVNERILNKIKSTIESE